MQFRPISNWDLFQDQNLVHPFLIAGPCAAESREQVLETAQALQRSGKIQLFRAGVWKPRTRPNSFEGLGEQALPWLQEVQQELGLPTCIEVATGQHVEQALKYGIKVLWIGARTTVNPFAVQEIADALQGVKIPVMVKNPVNPDLELWLGAFERLMRAGVQELAAIHRGFSVYNSPKYRNEPQWEIPIELRRRCQGLTILSDPSHIGGRRHLLLELAQQALDLDFDGLMIETHPQPDEAWSDAKQQITPAAFLELLEQLVLRQGQTTDPWVLEQLQQHRQVIDSLDSQLLALLGQRMEEVRQIGEYKNEQNMAILQLQRWEEILQTSLGQAAQHELSPLFVEQLMRLVHNEAIRQQMKLYQISNIS